MTDRAIQYIETQGDAPWALHLSFVKPHWPYVAPKPYHSLYTADQCLPPTRSARELEHAHPLVAAYRQHVESVNFSRDEVVHTVRPVYQGLVQQIDDELGRLWETLDRLGRWRDTLIIFTSDHGDFLGDYWLGEKELFHDVIQRVPFILYDPDPAADPTRGSCDPHFVSAVDVVPTVLDALGLPIQNHRLEGTSLLPLSRRGSSEQWRSFVVSELDYGFRRARLLLGRTPDESRGWMVRDTRWKYIHWLGYRSQLFDLENDPDEFIDLGQDAAYTNVRSLMHDRLTDWLSQLKRRVTMGSEQVQSKTDTHKQAGVPFGQW